MTYSEFLALSDSEKLDIVIESYSIAIREEDGYTVLLHKVNDFFVELYYHMEETRVNSIKPIESVASLELYLQLVSINEINKYL